MSDKRPEETMAAKFVDGQLAKLKAHWGQKFSGLFSTNQPAAATTPGQPQSDFVRIVDRNEEPTYVQIRVGEDWYTISKGNESRSTYERVAEAIKKFAAQFQATAGQPSGAREPRCPKCRSANVWITDTLRDKVVEVTCDTPTCKSIKLRSILDFAQFFSQPTPDVEQVARQIAAKVHELAEANGSIKPSEIRKIASAILAPYLSGEGRREADLYSKIIDLLATDELFVQPAAEGKGWVFWVNVNDMFYPASDAEGIDMSAIPELWQVWKDGDWPAVVRWVQAKRNGLPLRKVREERITSIEALQKEIAELKAASPPGAGRVEFDFLNSLRCIGGKLRLNLNDAATLNPEHFNLEGVRQLIAKWDAVVEQVVKQVVMRPPGAGEGPEEAIVAATKSIWELMHGEKQYDQWDIAAIIRAALTPQKEHK